ncbi:MAG: peptide chain release factor N(5)-glutamine methyltransferase [Deltaproteobacteria bacterium]|nr:peptide chain release factor N(5)-glutamine methyltransferase [Deltaproteobacteria bacterium]
MLTVLEVIHKTTDYLRAKGIEDARLNAELLLAHLLKVNRLGVYLNYDRPLDERELEGLRELIKQRTKRKPLQYIIGRQGFWSLELKVNANVLIPRPETELLVEETLKTVASSQWSVVREKIRNNSPLTTHHSPLILDLCTGSGCIAIALAVELPNAMVYAVDKSEAALKVAMENAEEYKVADRITFLLGNPYQSLQGNHRFDLIVSNPPYIRSGDINGLQPEVRDYEPVSALDGGEDGLEVIRRIITDAPTYLKEKGWLILEVGAGQASVVETLIERTGAYTTPSIIKDYSGIERVVKAQKIK